MLSVAWLRASRRSRLVPAREHPCRCVRRHANTIARQKTMVVALQFVELVELVAVLAAFAAVALQFAELVELAFDGSTIEWHLLNNLEWYGELFSYAPHGVGVDPVPNEDVWVVQQDNDECCC